MRERNLYYKWPFPEKNRVIPRYLQWVKLITTVAHLKICSSLMPFGTIPNSQIYQKHNLEGSCSRNSPWKISVSGMGDFFLPDWDTPKGGSCWPKASEASLFVLIWPPQWGVWGEGFNREMIGTNEKPLGVMSHLTLPPTWWKIWWCHNTLWSDSVNFEDLKNLGPNYWEAYV